MEIIQFKDELKKDWDEFCLASDDAWFWHTSQWLDYCVAYGKKDHDTQNISFVIIDDTGPIAICPLLLEKDRFSSVGGGKFGALPALINDMPESRREKTLKFIFEKIDSLAKENSVKQAFFRASPLSKEQMQYNWLIKYKYLDNSLNTQIIDLSFPLEKLWAPVRKGHKYDVNQGKKEFAIRVFSKENVDKEIFDQYRLLHHKAAGRVTRPLETFEMMYQWIMDGKGILCGASKNGKYVGFSYVCLYKDAAYYASASDDPEFETSVPISHVIQWEIITWLKTQEYRYYDIGIQQFGSQVHDIPSPKDLSISFFKRGFGGKIANLYRGVKYYDKNIMEKDLLRNTQMLIENYSFNVS